MTAPQVQDNDWNYLIVSGDAFRVEINKHNGYLTKYEVNGRDMIKDGEALKPNFWRAPVDNDYGANLQRKYIAWKNPEIKLTSFKQRTENNQVIVESAYDMPGVSAKLNLVYVINNAGAVKVTQKLTATRMPKYRTCSVSVCRCLCRAALKPLNTMDAVRLKTILTVIIAPT